MSKLISALPSKFPATVIIVQHASAHSNASLSSKLTVTTAHSIVSPINGQRFEPGQIYLSPPNKHILLKDDSIVLGNGPKENRVRPSIDTLFRSAAHAYGKRVIGIILSGVLNDGSAGLTSIKRHGGESIVQDPSEAVFDGMPRSAIAYANVDHVLRVDDIALHLQNAVKTQVTSEDSDFSGETADDAETSEFGGQGLAAMNERGAPSPVTCPACGGCVWQMQEESLSLFKCHTGHSFTTELLLAEQTETIEEGLWALMRSLDESVYVRRQLASLAKLTGGVEEANFHELQATNAQKQINVLRTMILQRELGTY